MGCQSGKDPKIQGSGAIQYLNQCNKTLHKYLNWHSCSKILLEHISAACFQSLQQTFPSSFCPVEPLKKPHSLFICDTSDSSLLVRFECAAFSQQVQMDKSKVLKSYILGSLRGLVLNSPQQKKKQNQTNNRNSRTLSIFISCL